MRPSSKMAIILRHVKPCMRHYRRWPGGNVSRIKSRNEISIRAIYWYRRTWRKYRAVDIDSRNRRREQNTILLSTCINGTIDREGTER